MSLTIDGLRANDVDIRTIGQYTANEKPSESRENIGVHRNFRK
jgi:lipoate synthase